MKGIDVRKHIQMIAENTAFETLQKMGFAVQRNGHNDHADLIIDGHITVEVKGSTFSNHHHSKGRYQFNTRQHPDFYALMCVDFLCHWFIIPGDAIGNRTNIAIWSENPKEYTGQWRSYLDNWDQIRQEANQWPIH